MGLLDRLFKRNDDEIKKLEERIALLEKQIMECNVVSKKAESLANAAFLSQQQINAKLNEIEKDVTFIYDKIDVLSKTSKLVLEIKEKVDHLYSSKTKLKKEKPSVKSKDVSVGEVEDLTGFSRAEKAIISVLLNAEMPLTYEDIASFLNKSPSTIRDHISSIKKKADIIEEVVVGDKKKMFKLSKKAREKILA